MGYILGCVMCVMGPWICGPMSLRVDWLTGPVEWISQHRTWGAVVSQCLRDRHIPTSL